MKKITFLTTILTIFCLNICRNNIDIAPTAIAYQKEQVCPVATSQDEHPEVSDLLKLIPNDQRDSFVIELKKFAGKRNFDWRLMLLLMYNESGINPQKESGQYVGLIMFGNVAREELGISRKTLVSATHLEQVRYAVQMWEKIEQWGSNYRIRDFTTLFWSTCYPAFVAHSGNPYMASEEELKMFHFFKSEDGLIHKKGVIHWYTEKAKSEKILSVFINILKEKV